MQFLEFLSLGHQCSVKNMFTQFLGSPWFLKHMDVDFRPVKILKMIGASSGLRNSLFRLLNRAKFLAKYERDRTWVFQTVTKDRSAYLEVFSRPLECGKYCLETFPTYRFKCRGMKNSNFKSLKLLVWSSAIFQ